jgi:hypothetical protein
MPRKLVGTSFFLKLGILFLVAAGVYYYRFSTTKLYERTSSKLLTEIQELVASASYQAISGSIRGLIENHARFHLELHMPNGASSTVTKYDVNKLELMNILDKLLYATKNYSFVPTVTYAGYNDQSKSEVVEFKAQIDSDRIGEWVTQNSGHYRMDALCGANIMNADESKRVTVLGGESNPDLLGSMSCILQVQYTATSTTPATTR